MGMSSTSVRKCKICEGENVLLYEGGEYHLGHNYEWDCLDCGMSYYSRQLVYRLELDEVNKLRTTRSNLTPLTELRSLGVKDDNIWDLHLVEYNETLTNLMEDELRDDMVYCDEVDGSSGFCMCRAVERTLLCHGFYWWHSTYSPNLS